MIVMVALYTYLSTDQSRDEEMTYLVVGARAGGRVAPTAGVVAGTGAGTRRR